jgi:hypothetical protein
MKSRGDDMATDKYDMLGPAYADIGGELAEIVGGDPDGVYLYAEAGEGWYGYAVFKNEGDIVRYYEPSSDLGDLIYDAWLAEEPDKRWAVMEYEIKGKKFDAQFQFAEEIDPTETEMERRPRALKKRYGDKPVIYPPWPGETTP